MTTPPVGTPPVNVPVGNTPNSICPQLKGMNILVQNLDPSYNLFVGYSAGITAANTVELPPGASAVMNGFQQLYAFTDSPTPPLLCLVSPGTTQYNLGPGQLAAIVNLTGLAAATALAIAQTGVSFLAAPVTLYQNPPITPASVCRVGSNIRQGTPHYSGTLAQNIATWQTVTTDLLNVRRVEVAGGALTVNIPAIFGPDIQAGRLVVVSFSPSISAGPNPTAQMQSDLVTLNSTLSAMKTAGVNAVIILFHEPSTAGMTQQQFQFSIQFYADTVQDYYPLYFSWSVGTSVAEGQYASFFINGLFDGVSADFYCSAYSNHNGNLTGINLSGIAALADNNTDTNGNPLPLPFGLGEMGWNPSRNNETATDESNYYNYLSALVTGFFPARAAANKVNAYMCWFNPTDQGPSTTDLSSTIYQTGQSQLTGYNQIFNNCDTTSSSSNLPTGTAVTLNPVNPSPVGGLASCGQLSYDFACDLIAGAGSTRPFVLATFTFYDFDAVAANLVPVDEIKATIPLGTSPNPAKTIAVGPMSGAYMSVQLHNLDSVGATLTRLQLVGSGRQRSVHDWRWDSLITPQAIPTYTLPSAGVPYGATLGAINNVVINAGNSTSALFSLFTGEVYLRINAAGSGGALGQQTIHFTLQPQPANQWGSGNLFSAYLPNAAGGAAAADEFEDIIALPRGPCLLTITNGDTISAIVSAEIIPIER